jgi:hypothetical protein
MVAVVVIAEAIRGPPVVAGALGALVPVVTEGMALALLTRIEEEVVVVAERLIPLVPEQVTPEIRELQEAPQLSTPKQLLREPTTLLQLVVEVK